jgi:hypothetical protein
MRVFILTVYVGLIAWIAVAGSLGTGVAMAAAIGTLAFAFRPMAAARAVTGWARASVADRG